MIPPRRLGSAEWLSAALVVAIGWFYFWTAAPQPGPGLVGRQLDGYYNLLARGFMKGHLYLDARVDPYLATLADPWDPLQRGGHGLHDASYYRGHYYLYFGPAPVLFLFLPFRVLTGWFISERLAVPIFACAGLALAAWLVLAVRRRHFPASSPALAVAGVLAIGLGNMVAVLLRRPGFWEVPIACGYACCMAGLAALFLALHGRRPLAWLAVASAAFGAAVASRPTYLFGCPAVLLALWVLWRERGGGRLRLAAAALGPAAFIGALLAAYNWLRFGNPLDFGFRRVMAGMEDTSTETIFTWRFLVYNIRVYLFAPARWSEYFPFVSIAKLPALRPAGYLGVEDPFGILPNLPFCGLGAGVLLLAGRSGRNLGRLPVLCCIVAIAAIGTGLATSCFGGAVNRYMVDFVPALALLACLGLFILSERFQFRGSRPAWAVVGLVLAGYSAAFGAFASLRHNQLLRAEHPALYGRLAHAFNRVSYAYDRIRGTRYGPLEMTVVFPRGRKGEIEPLVATGADFLSDYLYVHYLDPDLLRFGIEHTSVCDYVGVPVKLDYGRPHTLRIDLGSLYPPAEHPYFDGLPPADAASRLRTVRVTIDGRVAFDRALDFYDPLSPRPSLGDTEGRPGFRKPFSGRILSWSRLPDGPVGPAPLVGPLRLEMILPTFAGVACEPLLCTGVAGRGDLLYVRYEGPGRISFGLDHWGVGATTTPPVTVEPGAVQVLEVDFGALHPGPAGGPAVRTPLWMALNGRTVFDAPVDTYPCPTATVVAGRNPIGASSAEPQFTGRLVLVSDEWR